MAMHALLRHTAHRLYPPPLRPWVMRQTWRDLLFIHYPLPVETVRAHVPELLELDTYDGRAWLGITPLRIEALAPQCTPPLPVISHFPELNVRTYVTLGGKPGVFFFSLDAARLAAVVGARLVYGLPYFPAEMEVRRDGARYHYRSRRLHGPRPAELLASWSVTSEPAASAPGSLEHFLVERYCLYAVSGRRVYRTEVHHGPWLLQRAEATIDRNTTTVPLGLPLPDEPPLLHFARRQNVLVWLPERLW